MVCFRVVLAFGVSCCLFSGTMFAQIASPAKRSLEVTVEPPAPEQIITKTIDLNETASGYASATGAAMEEAWTEVRKQCGLVKIANAKDDDRRDFKPLRSAEIRPGVFQIVAGESYFQVLELEMQSLRCGKRHISVDIRVMRVSEEMLSRIRKDLRGVLVVTTGAENQTPKAAGKPSTTAGATPSPFRLPVAENKPRTHAQFVSAVTTTERVTPCPLAKLDDSAVKSLVDAIQNDTRSKTLQSPRVTMFPSQRADVAVSTQRPFVTSLNPVSKNGITAMEPGIEILEEGLRIALMLDLAGDQIELESEIIMSKIGEVDTFDFLPEGAKEEATIQIPELHTKKIELSQRLPQGVSLLIAPHFATERVEKKSFGRETKFVDYPLILLTPKVIEE